MCWLFIFFSAPLPAEIYDESDETERSLRQRDKSSGISSAQQRNDVSLYLNMFDPKLRGNRLSPQESQAVFAFLTHNIEVGGGDGPSSGEEGVFGGRGSVSLVYVVVWLVFMW